MTPVTFVANDCNELDAKLPGISPPNANTGIVILVLTDSLFCSASIGKALKYSNAERVVPGAEK